MAITYPLSAASFWELLRFADRPVFVPQHNRKQSVSGGGDILSTMYGRPKWSVNVTLSGGWHSRNLVQEADIMHLVTRDGTILAYDIRRPFPASDPGGTILGAAAVKVKTKGSNNRSISVEDLTAAYALSKGDKGSITYDTSKVFLFEIMESVTADGSGDTVEFEIWPPLPPDVAVGNPIDFIKPCGKFKVVANSFRPGGGAGNTAAGFSFSLISVP